MRLTICSFAVLTLAVLVHSQPDAGISTGGGGGGGGGKCTKRSQNFYSQTKSFLNCLNDKIGYQLDKVKPNKNRDIPGFVRSERNRLKNILKRNRCNRNIDKSVKRFLKEDMEASSLIYNDIADSLTEIVWETAKAPRLASCFLEFLREKFLDYIKRCSKMNIPTKTKEGLKPVPTLSTNYDLKAARQVFELYLKAYLAAYKCKITHKVREISAIAVKDTCECAKDRYKAGCIKVVKNEACKLTTRCIRDIFKNRESVMSEKELKDKAEFCWQDYKKFVAQGRGKKTVKLSDLVDPATKLGDAFGKLTVADKLKGAQMIQAFLDAQFATGFCSQCFG